MALPIGILVGFVLALPPGGVALIGMHLAISRGWKPAAPYALGSMIADVTYAAVALFAADAASESLSLIALRLPLLVVVLKALIVTLLIAAGTHILLRRKPLTVPSRNATSDQLTVRRARAPFLLGLIVNFSNAFISPTFIAALALFVAQAGAFGILNGSRSSYIAYAVGFGVGNLLYLLLLMRAAVALSSRMRDRQVIAAQRAAGCALATAGIVLGASLIATS